MPLIARFVSVAAFVASSDSTSDIRDRMLLPLARDGRTPPGVAIMKLEGGR